MARQWFSTFSPVMSVDKAFLLPILALSLMGCSNAPPNFYALGSRSENGPQFAGTARIVIPSEPLLYQYSDTAEVIRSDGLEGNPQWGNVFDFYTFDFDLSARAFHFGLYMSNLYPGMYAGIRNGTYGVALFSSAAVWNARVLPGVQVHSNWAPFVLSYSLYQENLGSILTLPWFGESGPSRKVLSEKYVCGFEIAKGFGVLAYVNRSYWKNVRTGGFEFYLNSDSAPNLKWK